VRKPSQRVLDNVIYYDEIPIDDPEVYVNNVFVLIEDEPIIYQEAIQRPDSQRWYAAINKEVKSLLNTGTWELIERATVPKHYRILKGK
jgi:hypothetical protein